MSSVLKGIRVLDLSRFIAGPLCAEFLGDLGAEVIKVERPGGEDSRKHSPFFKGESIYTMVFNRNKYGMTLDTRNESAPIILEKLVKSADIVVENYRPGTMEAMGLSFERLTELKPGIILVSISGFGQTGPLADRALFDAISQAASGLMSVTGDKDGSPTLTGTYIADYIAGYLGCIGALAAVIHQRNTGEGQHVDVASLDAMFASLGTRPSAFAMLGIRPERNGSRDLLTGPANVFSAKDGFIYIHAGTDSLFKRWCKALGKEDLLKVAKFSTVEGRMENIEELELIQSEWALNKTCTEISLILTEFGIPFSRIAEIPEVVNSDQIAAREMMPEVEHPLLGTLRLPGFPIKLSKTPGTIRKAPPMVGEDNHFIYKELLGFDEAEIEEFFAKGVI